MNKQDLKVALRNVSRGLLGLIMLGVKVATALLVAIFVFVTAVYIITHFFLQTAVVFGLLMLSVWFYIELLEARTIREYEETQRLRKDADRSNPC